MGSVTVNVNELRETLANIARTIPEPSWDLIVYCRFLAERLLQKQTIEAAEFGRLAEELIADLKEGVDRTTGQTFVPPLVSGRSDLLYDFIRAKLAIMAHKIGGPDFASVPAAGSSAPSAPAT